MSNKSIEIKQLDTDSVPLLYNYLIKNQGSHFKYFAPHPFELSYLYKVSMSRGKKDTYYVIIFYGKVIGYGMLRGLDEGYKIPTMGISIDKNFGGMGLATLFIQFMEMSCKLNGIYLVRIGVMKGNNPAKKLYESLGYRFTEELEDRWYAIKELTNEMEKSTKR